MDAQATLNDRLIAAGFQPYKVGEPGGDYVLEGERISEWLSTAACPFPELVRERLAAP